MQESRKFVILGVVAFVAVAYLVKLFYLQVVDDGYGEAAAANAIEPVVQIPYRGQIYDRTGKLIVFNTPVYDLYVTPKKARIADTARFCRLLNLQRPEFDSLMTLARQYSRHKSSLFMRQLSVEDFARIQDAMVDYPGFTFETSAFRTYTSPSMANSLGYIAEVSPKQLEEQEAKGETYYRQGDYIGKTGLEKQYEEILRGRRGIKYIMKDVKGVTKGSWLNGARDVQPIAGKNLYTSIDLEVQQYADSLFKDKMGSLVAIEPSTGEILAIVSAPSYDPKLLSGRQYSKNYARLSLDPYKPLINRPVQGFYRPGSTFKVIQALVALQEGAITASTSYSHAGAPMRCHGHPGLSGVDMALQYSCNPYFYHVFRKLINDNSEATLFKKAAVGLKRWDDRVAKFGIGQKLGVDLPSEVKGKLPDVAYYDKVYKGELTWKFSNIYSLSIGEGELLVSPMKLANVAAIVANRGWYITPHIVRSIGTPKGQPLPEYQVRHDVGVDARHFESVIDGMQLAVERGTVKGPARVPGLVICGKTGTSQVKVGDANGIFIGFAPRDNPKIAVACFVDASKWGGSWAAPITTFVMEKYLYRTVKRKAYEQAVIATNLIQGVPLPKPKTPAPPQPAPPAKPDTTGKGAKPHLAKQPAGTPKPRSATKG